MNKAGVRVTTTMNWKARCDQDRWGLVAMAYVIGYALMFALSKIYDLLYIFLAIVVPWPVQYAMMFVLSVAVAIMTRRFTKDPTWWLIPLFLSPLSVFLGFILLLDVLWKSGAIRF